MPSPIVLCADNFTPPSRTPWGGRRIRQVIKAGLGLGDGPPVGESWEFSVEPSFPSRAVDGSPLLALLAADATSWLGSTGSTPLLVKLLDAADDLSLQVHPHDGDPTLAPDESGKPEAWIVLAAEPGAGLYLGFRDGVRRADVERCLDEGGALDQLMSFVPVTEGDAFVIAAGTPHAIGRGLTLLEPQYVTPGRRGVTYRYWDWNRRYDPDGRRDPKGHLRPLHVERSLAVTAWDAPRGDAFVATCRMHPAAELPIALVIDWPWFSVERWRGTGAHALPALGSLRAVVCVQGACRIETEDGAVVLRGGQSGAIPACARSVQIELRDALAFSTHTHRTS